MKQETVREIAEKEATERRTAVYPIAWRIKDAISILAEHGFVVVPKEPTEEMIVAGDHKIIDVLANNSFALNEPTIAHLAYRAMLSALSEETGS